MPTDKPFQILVALVTVAFIWILWPFFGPIFWAVVLAIVFRPVQQWFCRSFHGRDSAAALATTALVVVLVILPAALLTLLVVQESLDLYDRVQSGDFDVQEQLDAVVSSLPPSVQQALDENGYASVADVKQRLAAAFKSGVQLIGARVVAAGQNTFEFIVAFFIMLYLLFYMLRDGRALSERVRCAIPLRQELEDDLFRKFVRVIRATIKGNFVVALIQGGLGGLIFWILGIHAPIFWAMLMAFFSLLPAIGTAIVWIPVALYLLVTGTIWKGLVLVAFGTVVIGLVDNIVRPILVGKETRMPDYLVLISTLGGITVFGLDGFVVGPVIAAMFVAVWGSIEGRKNPPPDETLKTS